MPPSPCQPANQPFFSGSAPATLKQKRNTALLAFPVCFGERRGAR